VSKTVEESAELPVEALATDAASALGIQRVLRKASGLSGASLLGSALGIIAGFAVARRLGPERVGDGQFVVLCYFYAAILRTGVFEGSVRAVVGSLGRGDRRAAVRDQNVGLSFDLVTSLVPGLVLAMIGLFAQPDVRRLGFFVAPLAVLASTASSDLGALWSARDRFDVVGWASVVRAAAGPAALVGLVLVLGTPGIFLGPIVTDFASAGVYLLARPALHLRAHLDADRARSLVRVGFPLGAAVVVYWAYRLVGSTSIAFSSSALALGLYTFAAAPVAVATRAISGVQAVLMPAVWSEYSAGGGGGAWVRQAERVTLALAVIAGATAGLAQAGFAPVLLWVVPGFAPSIRLFDILALTILLLPVATVPSLVLDSQRVNRQTRHLLAWVIALLVNAGANAAVLKAGWGAQAVAIDDVWVQFVVVIALVELAAPHMWGVETSRRLRLYAGLAVALLATVAVTVALDAQAAHLDTGHLDVGALLLRSAATLAVWAAVGALLVRPDLRRLLRRRAA